MKRTQVWSGTLIGLWLLCAPVASHAASSVRVYTEPAGLQFTIDGQTFTGVTDYIWEANSKHFITSYDQYAPGLGTRYIYGGSASNIGGGTLPVTADPAIKSIVVSFRQEDLLTVVVFDCGSYDPGPCPSPGVVFAPGGPYDRSGKIWLPHGSGVGAQAYPSPGWIFTGWAPLSGQPTPVNTSPYVISFVMNGPQVLQPFFWPARPVVVTIQTSPPSDIQIIADRTPYYAPIRLEWGWDTPHSVGAPPTQNYLGRLYVFDSWSDGGAINHDYKMEPGYTTITLIAKYVPAATVSVITSPPGLTVTVDGRQNWPSNNFIWGALSTHQILAPATQTDAQGHKYQFVSWSNGKPAAFSHVMDETPVDTTLIAKYQAVGQVTLKSSPASVVLQVDDSACTTPCVLERPAGSVVKVTAPSLIATAPDSRLVLQGWQDSADGARTFTVPSTSQTYTLNYTQQNRLQLSATPAEGASFTVSPASSDGFYDAGALVSISSQLALGFRFSAWTGDVTGNTLSVDLSMNGPKLAGLMLDRVPAIKPGSARNAANASAAGVTPGSLISVFGANLAPATEVGSGNPLPQTLQQVTARVNGTFLPLVFVSPTQINAQVPLSILPGAQPLIVRWEGKGESAVQISVMRNAPGLFSSGPADQPVGSFVRTDGQSVSVDSPARGGDFVSVLGTGFGPYLNSPPDGFLLDESAGYALADAVTVVLEDDSQVYPVYAGRSGAAVGVEAVRFQLPAILPDKPFLKVRIRIGEQDSNTVLLPISR